ncbi:hypothetical protein GpartN1_g248.t1 [Galdieria partita]|uniref:RING-type E3 ubiquitin transferase n=1 Tax=Galdieria partita TaxID=83374 RepID=A0A9C7PRL3_9RHOD|nr:hypothetical protein GpartN1_g248.t1 [Galdieria partita]
MSSTVTAIAIAGSIILSVTFAVVIIIVKRRMEVSSRYRGTVGHNQSDLLRAPPLITYFISSTDKQGLFQKDIDQLCKEYVFEGMENIQRTRMGGIQPSEENTADDKVDDDINAKAALCCICLEDLELGSLVRTLPCNHTFHSKEICRWLCKRAICPYCRASFEYLVSLPDYEETNDHFAGDSESDSSAIPNYISTGRQSQGPYHQHNAGPSIIMIVP